MSDFGQRTQAGHRVMQDIAERKRKKQPLEPLVWLAPNLVHEMDVAYDHNKPGELQLVQVTCKCGFETEWKSFSQAISEYENHADKLWEVASE